MNPQIGDIWNWSDRWTVLLTDHIEGFRWQGICLDDDEVGVWYFSAADMPNWRKLA